MHTTNEIELWREHRNELLREAKTERVACRLRLERPRFATIREGGR